jgi:hypothetical protein
MPGIDLSHLTDEEITQLLKDGKLNTVLDGSALAAPEVERPEQKTQEWLKGATPPEVKAALDAGQLVNLLGGTLA